MIRMFTIDAQGRLIRKFAGETLCVEAWGESSLRVRAVQYGCELEGRDGALIEKPESKAQITVNGDTATIVNGRIRAEITKGGKLVFSDITRDVVKLLNDVRAAGFAVRHMEDMSDAWKEYYLEALWKDESGCLPTGKKASYVLFVCERM